jgi:hypothetical protein
MSQFIQRTTVTSDRQLVLDELGGILSHTEWSSSNQLGLNRREIAQNDWHDASGSLFDNETQTYTADEGDFNIWNIDAGSYVRGQIELLASSEQVRLGRCRFMLLRPKTGLSVHTDREVRYHLVLQTNSKSYVAVNEISINLKKSVLPSRATCYHLPADNCWYRVDTRQTHWVYNGGGTDRIHLVVCATDIN